MEVTSFETTKRLLEAGFPASTDWGPQYYIDRLDDKGRNAPHQIGSRFLGNGKSNTIRASSALDILKILGNNAKLSYSTDLKLWTCTAREYGIIVHENSAEAVAEMYLKVNSK